MPAPKPHADEVAAPAIEGGGQSTGLVVCDPWRIRPPLPSTAGDHGNGHGEIVGIGSSAIGESGGALMATRPFMQLYVSDFLGDTLHLSTEEVGAYLLLLMAMWNAGGVLENDEAKLARITRTSAKKWRSIGPTILEFFLVGPDGITHRRLREELRKSDEKSTLRAKVGLLGGRAKALKDRQPDLPNASGLPWHSPEARVQIPDSYVPSQQQQPVTRESSAPAAPAAAASPGAIDLSSKEIERRCREAAGYEQQPFPGLFVTGPIVDLIVDGFDLEADILPVIRAKAEGMRAAGAAPARSWSYFAPAIREAKVRRLAAANAPPRPQSQPFKPLAMQQAEALRAELARRKAERTS